MKGQPHLSIVVPLFNEEPNVVPLVEEVREVLGTGPSWELVLVDDGSVDGTPDVADRLAAQDPRVRSVKLSRNYGQTLAIQAGFDRARGEVVVTMDGDLQNDPSDISRLVAKIAEGYDIVAGYRERRKDPILTRKIPSWGANWLIRLLTGIPIRDLGCGVKAYRRDLVEKVALYADMHRFVPIVAAGVASARLVEIPVSHRPRVHGESKYGLSRIWKVLGDLLTITMIRWFRDRPLVLFSLGAGVALTVGVFLIGSAFVLISAHGLDSVSPLVLPGAGLLQIGLAVYLIMLGLIAEVVVQRVRETRG